MLYDTMSNTIVSLASGSTTWASGNVARASNHNGLGTIGSVTPMQVVLVSDSVVLAQPY